MKGYYQIENGLQTLNPKFSENKYTFVDKSRVSVLVDKKEARTTLVRASQEKAMIYSAPSSFVQNVISGRIYLTPSI